MILDELRRIMEKEKIDCYIIPTLDPHGSEYLPEYYKERAFLTGFTGSAGIAVVTRNEAYLWTDGRYYIQAEKQIAQSGFKLQKQGLEGVLNYDEWMEKHLAEQSVVGFNGKYLIETSYEQLQEKLNNKHIEFVDKDLISPLWENRPQLPNGSAFLLEVKYAGLSREEKVEQIRDILNKKNADMTVISTLEDIAWTLNIRGNDIENTPVLLAYLVIDKEQVIVYAHEGKLDKIEEDLIPFVTIRDYNDFYQDLKEYKDCGIYIDPTRVNHKLYSTLSKDNHLILGENITLGLKAVKNKVELENQRATYIRDGVYLTKFIYWLKNEVRRRGVTEVEAAETLDGLRAQDPLFVSLSFNTISAYGSNAAMMHYSATKDSYSVIEPKGLYLVDSGGQYYSGTTDITRTIAMGELTAEEKRDFTITLKCHLMLLNTIFLKGTTDTSLDAIARYHAWQNYCDYKCGTGHGVGFFLSVHEGPQRLSPGSAHKVMEEGMIVSNEPGVYISGKHGIRIENIMEVVKDCTNGDGTFLKFAVLTMAPIEREAIELSMLTDVEMEQLNDYHQKVYENLSEFLDENERKWLKEVTRPIER